MKNKIYILDAFTEEKFKGNPAAVCPLEEWPEDKVMQDIAKENNLSETAFFKKEGDKYMLRWFTPEREIDLCGHATLASAYVIFNFIDSSCKVIEFNTMSGLLKVFKEEDKLAMKLPIREGERIEIDEKVIEALGVVPLDAYKSRDLMFVLRDEDDVKHLQPNLDILKTFGFDGIMITAKGNDVDFVSRFFVPDSVINEDPVTGSSHCTLIPYWAKRLNKTTLEAKQLSKRGGTLYCELHDNYVKISGKAVVYLEGVINI